MPDDLADPRRGGPDRPVGIDPGQLSADDLIRELKHLHETRHDTFLFGSDDALANSVTLGLQVASWRARRRGQQARGVRLSLAALGVGGVGAWLGGHLAYRQSAGANHAEQAPHVLPNDFTRLCGLDDLPEGRPVRLVLDANPVFVLRRGRRVDALYDQCAHLSGPLSEGELSGEGDQLCVTCPWHGSVYRISDGQMQRGPTTHPQPVLQVRVETDGTVLARLPEDG